MDGTDAPARGEIQVDVAIVGAGPAGLTAGYLLSKAGKRVAIIERDPRQVGGIRRTIEHEGSGFELGGHSCFSKNAAVVDLWNEILPGRALRHPPMSRICHEGKLYSYPPRPLEVLLHFGVLRSAACAASYAWGKMFPIREAKSFEEWSSNRFGRKLHSIFFRPYAEKVWGMPCSGISADWAAQRIKGLSVWNSLRPGRHPADAPPSPGQGSIWEAARDRIVGHGGIVLMGHGLKQLASDGMGGWRMTSTGPDGEIVVTAAHAISSAPMRELAARLYPLPVSTIEASRLRHRDFVTVALMVRSADAFPETWIYIHDSRVNAGRVQNLRASSAESEVACIAMEYFCSEGDGLWSMHDDKLIELARRELDILGLVPAGKVIGGVVVRQEKAYPLYDEHYAANVAAMREEMEARHPTLHLIGRNGMHRCNGQDFAVMTAMLTVENILAGQRIYDTWYVDEDAEYREADAKNVGQRDPAGELTNEEPERTQAPTPEAPQRVPLPSDSAKKVA